jgi:predicted dehydrogenase
VGRVLEAVSVTNVAGHLGQPLKRPLRVAIAGLGGRGQIYARAIAAKCAGRAEVVQLAERRERERTIIGAELGIAEAASFADWHELVAGERIADAVVIATQDRDHLPAIEAFAAAGYDILCEKPISETQAGCDAAVRAADAAGVFLGVCHVLRYTPNTRRIMALLAAGAIGDIVSIQHLEPVGYFHFAHSFVRGAWRREDESGPLLLTKSCHDLDWLSFVVGSPAARVSSFGSRTGFTPEHRPVGATDRCVTCPAEPSCAYSASRISRGSWRRSTRPTRSTMRCAPVRTVGACSPATTMSSTTRS